MTVWEQPRGASVEWYTPPTLFQRLGMSFDLDPAAPSDGADWLPVRVRWHQGGLDRPWEGRVWLNPPYDRVAEFMDRMCDHRLGMALTASRTETRWWQRAAHSADIVCLLRHRLHFIRSDGYQARSSHASTLFGWGTYCAEAIKRADLGWTVP